MDGMSRASIAPYNPEPVQRILERAASRWPDEAAVIDGARRFTFAELNDAAGKLAGALASLGAAPGKRVALLAPNCAEFEIAFFGVLKAGATVTTINSGYREREIAYQLNASGAELLIVHQDLADIAGLALPDAPNVRHAVVIAEGANVAVGPIGPIPTESFWNLINPSPPLEETPEGQRGLSQPPVVPAQAGISPLSPPLEETPEGQRGLPQPPVVPAQAGISPLSPPLGEMPEGQRGLPRPIDPSEDLAALPFSSGTTGLQKGVMLTHANLHANVRQYLERPAEDGVIRKGDVVLVHLPLFHIYGMTVLQLNAIAAGAVQVMMGRFDMATLLSLIAEHRVTALYTAPPVCLALSLTPLLDEYDVSSLRFVLSGAAPLSAELQTRLAERLGCPVTQGYGLTETSPVTNSDYIDERMRPGAVGPPLPDTEERIVDLESGMREMPRGELGELLIRGPQVMKGYFNQPEATAETITPDGWLHTGDIASMDDDGYVRIVDRKKELIKYKGFQVAPAELEAVLLEHPAVADAAVIPKPDAEAGEVPKAFVVAKPDATPSPDELMAFVAERVATFKQVREVEFTDAIPKNASGKLLRRVLIEQDRERRGSLS